MIHTYRRTSPVVVIGNETLARKEIGGSRKISGPEDVSGVTGVEARNVDRGTKRDLRHL